jgi:hypothetical protein
MLIPATESDVYPSIGQNSPFNIRQRRYLDSSRANARLVVRKQSRDVRWRARVCWRADSANCHSTALLRMSGMCADEPSGHQSLRILRIPCVPVV